MGLYIPRLGRFSDVAKKPSGNMLARVSESTAGLAEAYDKFRDEGNPNPARFEFVRIAKVGKFFLTEIIYPDCSNYEGHKILVFDRMFKGKPLTKKKIQNMKVLDPHFSNSKEYLAPIARFEPTERGWRMAIKLAKNSS